VSTLNASVITIFTVRVVRHEVLRSGIGSSHSARATAQTCQGAPRGCKVPGSVHGGAGQGEDEGQRHRRYCKSVVIWCAMLLYATLCFSSLERSNIFCTTLYCSALHYNLL
jgi:hypothetical protein